ncbi:MAG: METTL5 family protein [Methanomassiliicoccales archaeon]|nr:METTL5 family protein [Methanomassiliicoccales archaeon]
MKKRALEILLQQIPPLSQPKPFLEQYSTPATIAADVLFTAYANNDIEDKIVIDLGCGNGIFAIGASLLNSKMSIGVDADPLALKEAKANASAIGADVEFVLARIPHFSARADVAIQNPPFGSQRRGADRPFLETAMSVASVIYTMHNAETVEFVLNFVMNSGWEIVLQKRYKFVIPHMFEFHKKMKKDFDVLLLCIRRSGEKR